MPTLDDAVEGSTYVVIVSFVDEAGSAMVPATALWSLRDNTGAVVNSRSNVALTPATAMSVVLSGSDLVYEPNSHSLRTLTVTGTYDGAYGNNLPIAEEYSFNVRPLVGIVDA
jgi:hypothetical protein